MIQFTPFTSGKAGSIMHKYLCKRYETEYPGYLSRSRHAHPKFTVAEAQRADSLRGVSNLSGIRDPL